MDADRSSPEHPDPWATGRRRSPASPGRDLERRPAPPSDDVPHNVEGTVDERAGEQRPEDPWRHWRRLRPRSVRGASALGIVGAALFLFPFLDDPGRWWVPAGLGFGTLVLLALLRLDRLLNGWAPHVAGVVLVAALVHGTRQNPWTWGLALAAGVVVAGLLLLPRWKVLAVGGVLLVLSGIGYTFRSIEIRHEQARIDAQAGAQFRAELGVDRPQLALVTLDSGVVDGNPARVCRVVQERAAAQLTAATGTASCPAAVDVLHSRLPAGAEVTRPDREPDPDVAPGGTTTVDACGSAWGGAAPQLGRVELTRTAAQRPTFQVSAFAPC